MKDETKTFPYCPKNKSSPQCNFSEFMIETKLNTYTQTEKLIYDLTDKKMSNSSLDVENLC